MANTIATQDGTSSALRGHLQLRLFKAIREHQARHPYLRQTRSENLAVRHAVNNREASPVPRVSGSTYRRSLPTRSNEAIREHVHTARASHRRLSERSLASSVSIQLRPIRRAERESRYVGGGVSQLHEQQYSNAVYTTRARARRMGARYPRQRNRLRHAFS